MGGRPHGILKVTLCPVCDVHMSVEHAAFQHGLVLTGGATLSSQKMEKRSKWGVWVIAQLLRRSSHFSPLRVFLAHTNTHHLHSHCRFGGDPGCSPTLLCCWGSWPLLLKVSAVCWNVVGDLWNEARRCVLPSYGHCFAKLIVETIQLITCLSRNQGNNLLSVICVCDTP